MFNYKILMMFFVLTFIACGEDESSMTPMGGAAAPAGPCDTIACGQPCSVCTPGDTMCTPPMVATFCNAQKQCVAADMSQLSCMADAPYSPCAGKMCGAPCTVCAAGDANCIEGDHPGRMLPGQSAGAQEI